MNPIREWIEGVLRIAREQAEYGEFERRIQQQLFLFAIEIGRKKRLTPMERERYAKSLLTAEALLAVANMCPKSRSQLLFNEQMVDECVINWDKHEPGLKKILERVMGGRFCALDVPVGMWPEIRDMFACQFEALSRAYPDQVPPSELPAILDRLKHPLDRA
jgi:hypothetical protein